MYDPIERLQQIWLQAKKHTLLKQKSAICVSTINADGYPDGRFVDLKRVCHTGIVFCSGYDSQKGQDIARNPKVAITAWWEPVGYQVRLFGQAEKIETSLADEFWQSRNQSAKVISAHLSQSQPADSIQAIAKDYQKAEEVWRDKAVPRPENWGGFRVMPQQIELLHFEESRLHQREHFTKQGTQWQYQVLQP